MLASSTKVPFQSFSINSRLLIKRPPLSAIKTSKSNVLGASVTIAPERVRTRDSASSRKEPNVYKQLDAFDITLLEIYFANARQILTILKGRLDHPGPRLTSCTSHGEVPPV